MNKQGSLEIYSAHILNQKNKFMSTHLYNQLEIKASHEDMRRLLRKVVNQSNNKFELKSNTWEADSVACHSWDDGDECNYELTRNGDEMILRAEFNSKNVPPYYWAEKLVQQLPEISFTMFSSAYRYHSFLVRYSMLRGLEYYKNYSLLINLFSCKEVAEGDYENQYCYIETGELLNPSTTKRLIPIKNFTYAKGNLSYPTRLYIWLIKRLIGKCRSKLHDMKYNGLFSGKTRRELAVK